MTALPVETVRDTASRLHDLRMPTAGPRRAWRLAPTMPAVVLGSTQSSDDVDAARAADLGVEVARRRSGGGAVWVAPDDPVWIDIWIPRHDPWWTDDVQAAFAPVGHAWVRALERFAVDGLAVHDGPLLCPTGSRQVCFASVGPGEVVHGSAKVVGISQRRTRDGARFQCAVHRRWDPSALHGILRNPPDLAALRGVGRGLADLGLTAISADQLVDALATELR